MNKLLEEQLAKVEYANLSNFDKVNNKYFIPKRKDIRIEENGNYFIKIKKSLYNNEILKTNWNNNSLPECECLCIEVEKSMGRLFQVAAVGYTPDFTKPISYY